MAMVPQEQVRNQVVFGWEFTDASMPWGIVNGSGNRYRDGLNKSHEDGKDMTGHRQFMVRWDIGGSYDTDYYNYPATLEAGKSYEFYWDYSWGNTGSNPEMTVSIGEAKDGSDAIASAVFATPSTKELYRSGAFSFYCPTSGQHYLKISSNTGAWYGATNMSLTEITTPSIMTGESELTFSSPGITKSFTVTPIHLTEAVSITTPTGFSLSTNSVATDAGQNTIEITFNGTSNTTGYIISTSGSIKDSIYVEGVAEAELIASEAYLTFDDEITTATFTVSGNNLSEDISITAPTGFSVDNATVAQAAGETTITATFDGLTEIKDYIMITSSGATEKVRVLGYINDAPLYSTGNLISNYSLNTQDGFSGWGAASRTIITDTAMVYSGKSCLKMSGACGGSLDYDLTSALESNTAYKLRAMTYGKNFTFYLSQWNIDGSDKVLFTTTDDSWIQLEKTIITGDLTSKTPKLFFNSCEGTRGSLAYLDNYELYKMPMYISESSLSYLEGGDKTVAVSAQMLTEDITITAPSEFSVSPSTLTSAANSSLVTITYSGNATTSGYVKFTSGIYTDSVFVEGVADPTLNVTKDLLTFDDQMPTATFTVTGGNLSEDIAITAPSGFSVDIPTVNQTAGETTITITFDALAEARGNLTVVTGSLSHTIRVIGFINAYVPLYPTGNLLPDPYMMAKEPNFSGWGYGEITTDTLLVYDGKTSYYANSAVTGWPNGATLDYGFPTQLENNTYYCIKAMLKTMDGTFTFTIMNADINNLVKYTNTVATDGVWKKYYKEFLTGTISDNNSLFFNNADGGATGTQAFLDNYEMYKLPIHLSADSITFEGTGDSTVEVTAQLTSTDAAYAITAPTGINIDASSVDADGTLSLTVSYDNATNAEGYIVFDNGTYVDSVYVKATKDTVTSIAQTNMASDLVYISNENINVKIAIAQSGVVTYRVYNLQGALVASQVNNYTVGTHTTVLNTKLRTGAYLLNIIKDGKSNTYKIIK